MFHYCDGRQYLPEERIAAQYVRSFGGGGEVGNASAKEPRSTESAAAGAASW